MCRPPRLRHQLQVQVSRRSLHAEVVSPSGPRASRGSVSAATADCPRRSTGTRSYCHSYRYAEASVLDYGCDTTAYSYWKNIETTYSGQSLETYSFRFATLTFSDADDSYGSSTRTIGGVDPTDDSYGSSTKTIGGVDPTDDTVDSSAVRTNRRTRPPSVGPIVGGVVGGLALIGLAIAVGLVFLHRRRRHRRVQAAVGAAGQAPPPGYGPAGQVPPFTKVDAPFDPSMQQQQQQQQSQELPLHSSMPSGEPATTPLPASNRGAYMSVPMQDFSVSPPNVQQLNANWASPPPRYLSGSSLGTDTGTGPIYQAP